MERVVHKSSSHEEPRLWDVKQHNATTPEERMRAARVLKDRAFSPDAKDVREWHPLDAFWDGDVLGLTSATDLSPDGTLVQFGRPKDLDDLSYLTGGASAP